MEKVSQLTQDQYVRFQNCKNPRATFKRIIGLPFQARYELGDTAIQIKNAQQYGVYKKNFKGKDFYYIIISIMDDETAFAASLYPTT